MKKPASVVAGLINSMDEYERSKIVEHALEFWSDDQEVVCDTLRAVYRNLDAEVHEWLGGDRSLLSLETADVFAKSLNAAAKLAQEFYIAGVVHGILSVPGLYNVAKSERVALAITIMRDLAAFFETNDDLDGILSGE